MDHGSVDTVLGGWTTLGAKERQLEDQQSMYAFNLHSSVSTAFYPGLSLFLEIPLSFSLGTPLSLPLGIPRSFLEHVCRDPAAETCLWRDW